MSDLPPPLKVSPLIKFFRYSFLSAGIVYGILKHQMYKALENSRAEQRAQNRLARDALLLEEKRLAAERDFEQIAQVFKPAPKLEPAHPKGMDSGEPLLTSNPMYSPEESSERLYKMDDPTGRSQEQDLMNVPLDLSKNTDTLGDLTTTDDDYIITGPSDFPLFPEEDTSSKD
ncbi:uncharacterized protein LOC126736349 [Anthonomus grandis grandis]|uniref:uncharacterized protein LOC126736349 n=1 Tax=Anthonomus grandis grandis TaxID=2921223 RepID=UPI002166A77A|nr:uncharacterized protein LOC126736349 [Anthonomus grandis grandis]